MTLVDEMCKLEVEFYDGVRRSIDELGSVRAVRIPHRELWFRDSDHLRWAPLDALEHAQEVIMSRSHSRPWATIKRVPADQGREDQRSFALEVLGDQRRMYAAGNSRGDGWGWFWSSWPEHYEQLPKREAEVGPLWYQARVWKAQIMTATDAVTQLLPALYSEVGVERQAVGFAWRNRKYDLDPLRHLRSPVASDETRL